MGNLENARLEDEKLDEVSGGSSIMANISRDNGLSPRGITNLMMDDSVDLSIGNAVLNDKTQVEVVRLYNTELSDGHVCDKDRVLKPLSC